MKRIVVWILLIAFILSGLAAAVLADAGGETRQYSNRAAGA